MVAGVIGWAADRIAVHAGSLFPSSGYLLAEIVWKLATLGIMAWGLWRFERRRLDLAAMGFGTRRTLDGPPFPLGLFLIVLVGAVILWVTVGSSATSGSSYGKVHHVGTALIIGETLVRYPLTAFVEEGFFRGWLQPRLGRQGPVLAAVLWGVYHLQQVSTIPSLVVFGLALGALRWWLGNVRLTTAIHYVSDITFFAATYA